MDGRSIKAGSVDGFASAVKLARYVLEDTDHVIIAGHGAKALAVRAGRAVVCSDEKIDVTTSY
ncbi:MAG: isoaspartyl peptidase/L-asparaginase [Pyrobaculum sp.]